jgi:hypothetical protein
MTRARRSTSDDSRHDVDIGQTIVVIRRRTPPSTGIQVGASLADRPRNRTRPAKSRTTTASNPCLPDEKLQVQNLSEVHEHEQKSRKDGGSWSAVLACSRLFPARGAAKGPQRWAKGTARRRQSKRRIGRIPFAIRALIERTVPSRGGPCHRLAHNTHKGLTRPGRERLQSQADSGHSSSASTGDWHEVRVAMGA